MNVQLITEKVLAEFPDLDLRDYESEAQRTRILRDFYYAILLEFTVDVDNVTRLQLCQEISGDDAMITLINLKCTINALIPDKPIGLFDLLGPSQNFLWSRLDYAVRFFKFADDVVRGIYDECHPYLDAKSSCKHYYEDRNELIVSCNSKSHMIDNKTTLIAEIEEDLICNEDSSKNILDARRCMQLKVQQALAKNEMLSKKKQQLSDSLSSMKNQLWSRKNVLDQSFSCDKNILSLTEMLNQLRLDKGQIDEKMDTLRKRNSELSDLKETLANRHSSSVVLLGLFKKLKQLEVEKKAKEVTVDERRASKDLDEINAEISRQDDRNDCLTKNCCRELKQLLNSLERSRDGNYLIKDKLISLKSNFKDVKLFEEKIHDLDTKLNKLKESHEKEEAKIKNSRETIAKFGKERLKKYYENAKDIKEYSEDLKQKCKKKSSN